MNKNRRIMMSIASMALIASSAMPTSALEQKGAVVSNEIVQSIADEKLEPLKVTLSEKASKLVTAKVGKKIVKKEGKTYTKVTLTAKAKSGLEAVDNFVTYDQGEEGNLLISTTFENTAEGKLRATIYVPTEADTPDITITNVNKIKYPEIPEEGDTVPTNPLNIKFDKKDPNKLVWDAPESDGGVAVTHYDVIYRYMSGDVVFSAADVTFDTFYTFTEEQRETLSEVTIIAKNPVGYSEKVTLNFENELENIQNNEKENAEKLEPLKVTLSERASKLVTAKTGKAVVKKDGKTYTRVTLTAKAKSGLEAVDNFVTYDQGDEGNLLISTTFENTAEGKLRATIYVPTEADTADITITNVNKIKYPEIPEEGDTVPTNPFNIKFDKKNPNKLVWEAPENDGGVAVTHYDVIYRYMSGDVVFSAADVTFDTFYTFTDEQKETLSEVTIIAKNPVGYSEKVTVDLSKN